MEPPPLNDPRNIAPNSAPIAPENNTSGISRVKVVVDVPAGTCLEVEVEAHAPDGRVIGRHILHMEEGQGVIELPAPAKPPDHDPAPLGGVVSWILTRARQTSRVSPLVLVWTAIAIYGLVRLIALDAFPIYFFTDEAVQTVLASDFLRDHLHNYDQEFLPTFFKNGPQYNLGTSVYWQVIPTLLFGKSIWVTRGAAALATLAAAFAVAGISKRFLNNPFPWLVVLVLSATPAWFLHSRTAFETSLATTGYAVFLYFYLLYRCHHPRYLYGVVILAAFTFYTYSPARVVVLAAVLLLAVSDARYHWTHRWQVARAAGLALLLALPYLRFWIEHPAETGWHMRLLGSYWVNQHLTLGEKIVTYAGKYLQGLDPLYWYLPHTQDLARHTMAGYGHLGKLFLPLGLLGVGLALFRLRRPAQRTILAALLAAPAGAAMVDLGVTRALGMVIPMALLTAEAIAWLLERARQHWHLSSNALAIPCFILLAGWNLIMLGDAWKNGPLWYNDYGLTGMQYGARQLFGETASFLKDNPGTKLTLSPSWANGTDVIARFFFNDPLPFQMGNINGYTTDVLDLNENMVFVLTSSEYQAIPREKFSEVKVEKILYYPNGKAGFVFVRLRYVDNIAEILGKEAAERLKPVAEMVVLEGVEVQAFHSRLDMGKLELLFDGDEATLIRTDQINPLQFSLQFASPRAASQVRLLVGGPPTTVTVQVLAGPNQPPVTVTQRLEQEAKPRYITLDLGGEQQVREMKVEIFNTLDTPKGHVHLWEMILK